MSYETYKIIHFVSVIAMFFSIGTLLAYAQSPAQKKFTMILHGVSTLILFISGFGLIARLGLSPFPNWLFIKMAIWGVLSIMVPILVAKKINKTGIYLLVLACALTAVIMVVLKI